MILRKETLSPQRCSILAEASSDSTPGHVDSLSWWWYQMLKESHCRQMLDNLPLPLNTRFSVSSVDFLHLHLKSLGKSSSQQFKLIGVISFLRLLKLDSLYIMYSCLPTSCCNKYNTFEAFLQKLVRTTSHTTMGQHRVLLTRCVQSQEWFTSVKCHFLPRLLVWKSLLMTATQAKFFALSPPFLLVSGEG